MKLKTNISVWILVLDDKHNWLLKVRMDIKLGRKRSSVQSAKEILSLGTWCQKPGGFGAMGVLVTRDSAKAVVRVMIIENGRE